MTPPAQTSIGNPTREWKKTKISVCGSMSVPQKLLPCWNWEGDGGGRGIAGPFRVPNNSLVRWATPASLIFNGYSIILPAARYVLLSTGSPKQMGFVRLNGTFRHCNLFPRVRDQIWRKATSRAHCGTYVPPWLVPMSVKLKSLERFKYWRHDNKEKRRKEGELK